MEHTHRKKPERARARHQLANPKRLDTGQAEPILEPEWLRSFHVLANQTTQSAQPASTQTPVSTIPLLSEWTQRLHTQYPLTLVLSVPTPLYTLTLLLHSRSSSILNLTTYHSTTMVAVRLLIITQSH